MNFDEERYLAAAHGMQSGVAAMMEFEPAETTPKHLRVGVNSAMVEHSALVLLLIEKGVISKEEFDEALADAMERERDDYAQKLSKILGKVVHLG